MGAELVQGQDVSVKIENRKQKKMLQTRQKYFAEILKACVGAKLVHQDVSVKSENRKPKKCVKRKNRFCKKNCAVAKLVQDVSVKSGADLICQLPRRDTKPSLVYSSLLDLGKA